MKVLLIQSYLGHNDPPVYPLGLSYIATFLNDHEVKLFDPNVAQNPWPMMEKELSEFAPDVAGISLRNIDNQRRIGTFYYYKVFEDMIGFIKRCQPSLPLVVGGSGFSMFAQKIMERNSSLDFGIYLEGEETFPKLLQNLDRPEEVKGVYYRKNGTVSFTGPLELLPDFKALPSPRRDLIDVTKYVSGPETIGIQTKRGCFLKCAYCNYPFLSGAHVRARSPKQVVDEIEDLTQQGINQFMFADGIFNLPVSNAVEICDEIIHRGIKVKWSAWLSLNHSSEEFLVLAKKAGCTSVTFSPDAVSEQALKKLRKGITEEDIKKSLRLFVEKKELRDLNVNYHIFVNPPGETLVGFIKTLLFYIKTKLLIRGRGGVVLGWIRIEPETRVYEIALQEKLLDADSDLLPKDEKSITHLFYSRPYLRHLDLIVVFLLKTVEILKKIFSWIKPKKTS